MIEVSGLTKKYGNHKAVDNLSFKVEEGQIYGFLGPNGAGKSTTMNIITGYLAASEGTVLIDGHDVIKEPEEAKKCIGYLPELPPLYMEMTVYEYLHFVAELKKVEKSVRKVQIAEIMDLTGIAGMKNRLIRNLSKGYKQRVGLAQAIIGYPKVIILDEPSVGLDPKQIIEMRELIKKLGENHTIILSSHILSEVSAVCDHIMIISGGKLIASETTENLSKRMSGGDELSLTVKGDENEVKGALVPMMSVTSVEVTQVRGEEVDVLVMVEKGADIREAVFFKFADMKMPILSMSLSQKSLEDIFLELTGAKEAEVVDELPSAEIVKEEQEDAGDL